MPARSRITVPPITGPLADGNETSVGTEATQFRLRAIVVVQPLSICHWLPGQYPT